MNYFHSITRKLSLMSFIILFACNVQSKTAQDTEKQLNQPEPKIFIGASNSKEVNSESTFKNNFSKESPISVDSSNQYIDLEKDTMLFSGDVIAKQDTLIINADTILIENLSSQDEQVITATGNPVYFEQWIETKNGKELVKGNGLKLVYKVVKDTLVLTDKAIVYKPDGTVKGHIITYNLENNTIQAASGSGQRVNTVIIPAKK